MDEDRRRYFGDNTFGVTLQLQGNFNLTEPIRSSLKTDRLESYQAYDAG
jgi:hypothetical protein